MPSPAYRFLEYVFLALLYLFFLRVVRAVWVELREPRLVSPTALPTDATVASLGTPGTMPAPPTASAEPPGGPRGRRLPTRLVVTGGPHQGVTAPLGPEITIGRAVGCALALPEDTFVSQLHARVFARGDDYWVEDLGSTNGTLLNSRKVTGPQPLKRGDHLQIGQSILEAQK